MIETPYQLNLSTDVREAVERELCRLVAEAVKSSEPRDNYLQTWRDQMIGTGVSAQNKVWKAASDIYDNISIISHLTLLSQVTQALHRDPKAAVEAFTPRDEDNARLIERWLSVEGNKIDIDAKIYSAAYNACIDPNVAVYVGWQERTEQVRDVGYRKQGDARIYTEEERDEDEQYEEVPITETTGVEGFDIRIIDLIDLYPLPADTQDLAKGMGVAERMWLTAYDLLEGIDNFGFNEDAVHDLLMLMPQGTGATDDSYRDFRNQTDGVESDTGRTGYYEVFTVYTRLPYLLDERGKPLVPSYLFSDRFQCVCVPRANIVLRLDFSPYRECPYYLGSIMPITNRLQGHGLMALLEAEQAEATAQRQFNIDSMNLTMMPIMKVLKTALEQYNKMELGPGVGLPVDTMNDIEPLVWDRSGLRDGVLALQDCRNQAQSIVSASGFGQLSQKQRKQGEIDNVLSQVNPKFGMFLWNFQRTVVAELFRRMIALKLEFGGVDDEGEEFSDLEGHPAKLTKQALMGRYRIVPTATSLTYSPEARVEVDKQLEQIVTGYLLASEKIQDPKKLKLLWHLARQRLVHLGEQNIESLIGEEPEAQPPQQPPQVPFGPPQQQLGQMGQAVGQPPINQGQGSQYGT